MKDAMPFDFVTYEARMRSIEAAVKLLCGSNAPMLGDLTHSAAKVAAAFMAMVGVTPVATTKEVEAILESGWPEPPA